MWKYHTLLTKIRRTGTTDWQPGSGRPRSVRVNDNIENVKDTAHSKRTNRFMRSRETGIHRLAVHRSICWDSIVIFSSCVSYDVVHWAVWNQAAVDEVHWSCSQLRMVYRQKNVYHRSTIQLAVRLGLCATRNQEVAHQSQLSATHALNIQQVSYGFHCRTKMGMTDLMFVDPVVKVNGQYYCNVLLSHQLLLAIKHVAGQHICLSTRQCSVTSHSRLWHHPAAAAGDTRLHRSWSLAAKQSRSEPRPLQDLRSHAAVSI